MKKKDFMELLLCAAIQSVTIVSVPDYNGGRQMTVLFNEDEVELGDFEYVEFSGDATEVLRNRSKVFTEHFEPFHEPSYDVEYTLQELVCEALA